MKATPIFPRWIADLSAAEQASVVRALTDSEAAAVGGHFPNWAHDGQCPPNEEWRTWVIMGGRGFGKTRAGAEWIAGLVHAALHSMPGAKQQGSTSALRIALVGATIDEARRVMVEGPSGLIAVARELVSEWHPSRLLLRFVGGGEAQLYSGASPESLRGPEHSHAWCDELAKWRHAEASWAMLQLGLRVGKRPRALITTTPREGPLLGRILAETGTVVSGGRTGANPHLPPAFVSAVEGLYGGTRMGRFEIDGAYDGTVAGQLFPAALLAACRVALPLPPEREGSTRLGRTGEGVFFSANDQPSPSSLRSSSQFGRRSVPRTDPKAPELALAGGGSFLMRTWPAPFVPSPRAFERITIGVDPPSGGGTCGIIVCGIDGGGHGHVLADHSVSGASPEGWAKAVVAAVTDYRALSDVEPVVVAEVNQGGAMVISVLRKAGLTGPIRAVHAKEGKAQRAVPIAMLFEQGRVSLHGELSMLEEELGGLIAGAAYQGPGVSPDRADAMVWALGEVMVRRVVRVVGFD